VVVGDANERERVDAGEGGIGDERDDEPDDDDDDDDELNGDKLLQLKRNDPTVTALEVNFSIHRNYALCVDWKRKGDCIGENTHLKSLWINVYLELMYHPTEDRMANFEAFYKGVARNRSIRNLSMSECLISIGDMFTILSPFFEHNHNLRSFEVGRLCMDSRGTRLLVSALSRCSNTSLRTIKFRFTGMDNEGAARIVTALAMHNKLRKLTLCFGNTGGWCDALAQLLRNPNSKLKELDIGRNYIDDEGATVLGNALAKNNTLKKLSLYGNQRITSTGWMAFSSCCLENANSSLEELNLSENNIGDDGVAAFAAALVNNTTLEVLDMSYAQSVSAAGWGTFFNLLMNSNSALETLDLSTNHIGDEGVASMVDSLANMSSLKCLNLRDNQFITATGWRTLSNLLRHPNCILEELHLEDNDDSINDEVVIAFANSLANNISLKALCLGDYSGIIGDNTNITPRGWSALANTLCNKSSIDSIYASNHTLQTGSFSESDLLIDLPSDFVSSLQLNQNNNKFEVAREKILQHHFCNGDINIQELLEIELQVMCHAIAWIGRDGTGFPLLYHLVRSMPALFDFDSQGKANGTGAKRQRICEKG